MIIRINFVPKEEKKKITLRLNWGYVYLICLGLTVCFILVSFVYINHKQSSLLKKKSELEFQRLRYIAVLKQIKSLEKENRELKRRINTIISLKKYRGYQLKVFDKVLLCVPLGELYLTNFVMKDSLVYVEGIASDYGSVADFLERLENEKIFSEVVLQDTKQKVLKNMVVVEFRVSIKYKRGIS